MGGEVQAVIDVIELAQRLIRTPSPVIDGDEVAVAGVIQDALRETGLPAAREISRDPRRPNLVSTTDFGPGGRHLVLCGHIDTKPVGEAKWTADPFGADIDGDRLYGLGSGDMKAAVAAMIAATEQLTAHAPARGRVTLLFVADEENGAEYGARFLAPRIDLDADAILIGEPSGIHADFDGLHTVSRGLGRFAVTAHAEQGHSSLSALLDRRVAGADLAEALTALRGRPVRIPENVDGLRDWDATVNPGMTFRGGWGYGVLPETMTATVEVRTLPGMVDDELRADLRDAVSPVASASGSHVTVDFDGAPDHWIDGSIISSGHPLVASARRASAEALGAEMPLSVFPGTTDASWFAACGIPSLPALGPGLISRAHAADEWVSVAEVRRAVDLYRAIAADFCAAEDGIAGEDRHV